MDARVGRRSCDRRARRRAHGRDPLPAPDPHGPDRPTHLSVPKALGVPGHRRAAPRRGREVRHAGPQARIEPGRDAADSRRAHRSRVDPAQPGLRTSAAAGVPADQERRADRAGVRGPQHRDPFALGRGRRAPQVVDAGPPRGRRGTDEVQRGHAGRSTARPTARSRWRSRSSGSSAIVERTLVTGPPIGSVYAAGAAGATLLPILDRI